MVGTYLDGRVLVSSEAALGDYLAESVDVGTLQGQCHMSASGPYAVSNKGKKIAIYDRQRASDLQVARLKHKLAIVRRGTRVLLDPSVGRLDLILDGVDVLGSGVEDGRRVGVGPSGDVKGERRVLMVEDEVGGRLVAVLAVGLGEHRLGDCAEEGRVWGDEMGDGKGGGGQSDGAEE